MKLGSHINRGVSAKLVPLRLHLSSDAAAHDEGSSEAVLDGRMASVAGVGWETDSGTGTTKQRLRRRQPRPR